MCTIMLAIKLAILHHQLGDFWLRNACRWRHTTIFILGTLTEHSRQPDSESPLSLANRRSEHACRTIRAVNPRGEQFHTTNGFVHKSLERDRGSGLYSAVWPYQPIWGSGAIQKRRRRRSLFRRNYQRYLTSE
ncbi:hypothetical protein DMN91_001985 [Ooceraea biroi]|uniref:Secreted protein n=1 Tax=Ooceraea biroi TaxID=2015173 RepID=A0A3L8E0C1_OOCBI|nr:uncharacterized protein LOC105287033 isoform X1 [Ooceraea biroi]RLU25825.1 hypothetical protein DMN91_001985 [Ooceraea biroi]